MKTIRANGIDFAYLEAGPPDGQLALCLHGFPDHAHTYDALLSGLADAGFHAVAPWMRGYAPTSTPDDGRYATSVLGQDAVALADALSPGRDAVLVGHDWGAAATYKASMTKRFRRIVGMAVPPTDAIIGKILFSPDQLMRSWYIWFFQLPVAEMAVTANDLAFIDKIWADWAPGFKVPDDYMRGIKDAIGPATPAIGYYRAMFAPPDDDPALAAFQASGPVPVPALYLHGGSDDCMAPDVFTPDELQPHFAAGVEVEIVEGAGHFLHLERPDIVNPRIVAFLSG